MEVAHSDDHVTSAVIGGSEKVEFGVADSAFLMQMLSASLYKDQNMALVREVLCNADDAHKITGQTRPFTVILTDEKLIIRDYGPGIAHDKMGPVYLTFGGSTKRESEIETGGFGLGCKAPFSYTDSFQVTSWHNGTKTVYRLSKSDGEVGGKPSCIKIVQVPTTETGLEVSINLKSKSDSRSFAQRIVKVLANGEMHAEFNGKLAKTLPYSKMTHGYMLTTAEPLLEDHRIMVRYGAVIYPISRHDDYRVIYDNIRRILDEISRHRHHFNLVLQAPPGSLSLTPSRETLTITPTTTETTSRLLHEFVRNYSHGTHEEVVKLHTEAVNTAAANLDYSMLVKPPSDMELIEKYADAPEKDEDENVYVFDSHEMGKHRLQQSYPGQHDNALMFKDLRHRIHLLVKGECLDTGLDRGLMRIYGRALQKAGAGKEPTNHRYINFKVADQFVRSVVLPAKAGVAKTKHMDITNFWVLAPYINWTDTTSNSWYGRKGVTITNSRCTNVRAEDFFRMQRRIVVITHDVDEVTEKLRTHASALGFRRVIDMAGAVIYQTGRSREKVAATRAHFAKLKHYKIVDLTLEIEYKEPKARKKVDPETRKKLEGFPTLRGVRAQDGSAFIFDWNLMKSTEDRVEKPSAFCMIYSKSDHMGRGKISAYSKTETADAVLRHYGGEVAVALTSAQSDKLEKAGVPTVYHWVRKTIMEEMDANKSLLGALPGTKRVCMQWVNGVESGIDATLVRAIYSSPELIKLTKAPKFAELSEEDTNLYHKIADFRGAYAKILEHPLNVGIVGVKPSQEFKDFIHKLASNPMLELIDADNVADALASDDQALVAKVMKLIKTILKG